MPEPSQAERKPIVLSIANQKGGVGKTTTAVNLGAGLALRGYKVLVLDFDIQANATHILHKPLAEGEPNLAEAMLEDATLDELILETSTPGLFVACSGETMVRVDLALAGVLGREETLKRILQESEKAAEMDFVVIDCSPYLGLLTVNALVASDYVLIPVSCEYLPMLGLKLFLSTIRTVQKRLNDKLEVIGYLLTMYDRREKITFEVERILRNHFEDLVFMHPIRINTRHKSSPAHRQTIFQYEGKSGRGVEDYTRLTGAVLTRMELPQTADASIPEPVLPDDVDDSDDDDGAQDAPKSDAAAAPPADSAAAPADSASADAGQESAAPASDTGQNAANVTQAVADDAASPANTTDDTTAGKETP